MENANFADAAKLANEINAWVSKVTSGKVSSLVDQESLANAAMVLVNAVYFQGLWKFPFDKTMTKDFLVQSKKNVSKEFIEQTAEFHYYYSKALGAKILRLPYEGKKFSMFLLLPFAADGLNDLIQKIDAENLTHEVGNMEATDVHVVLPKFKFDSSTKLNSVVKAVKINSD